MQIRKGTHQICAAVWGDAVDIDEDDDPILHTCVREVGHDPVLTTTIVNHTCHCGANT